jgi:uncharacterized protein (DUF2235 family)
VAKNLVFCADGTWNGPDRDPDDDDTPGKTNVLKLFELLSGALRPGYKAADPEQEKAAVDGFGAVLQHAKYLHGVGDSANAIIRMLGGGVGAGIERRIIRGYTYLSRNYAAGDRIYLTGFSRGAYTVRTLAGMVAAVGLLDATRLDLSDKRKAYRYGITAWSKYRYGLTGRFTRTQKAYARHGIPVSRDKWLPEVPIRAVGVWDTVGALGIPFYRLKSGRRIENYRFADHALSPKVQSAYHALSVDERRADFSATLWDPRDGVEQVWFAGAHADVGGGYPADESLLSNIALTWLLRRLRDAGLLITGDGADLPRNAAAAMHKPWEENPWKNLPQADRAIPDNPLFHASLYERKDALGDAYAPAPLQRFTTGGHLDPRYRE